MAFFDELSKTLSSKGKVAAQKAKDVAEVVQMKTQIASDKAKLKELYAAIGTLYFKKYRDNPENDFQTFFPEIEKTLAHMAELEAKVRELDGTMVCASCGASLKKNDGFCSKCGAKAEVPVEPEMEEAEVVEAEIVEEVAADETIFVEEEVTVVEEQ